VHPIMLVSLFSVGIPPSGVRSSGVTRSLADRLELSEYTLIHFKCRRGRMAASIGLRSGGLWTTKAEKFVVPGVVLPAPGWGSDTAVSGKCSDQATLRDCIISTDMHYQAESFDAEMPQ